MSPNEDDQLTVPQVAARLDVEQAEVLAWLQDGRLKGASAAGDADRRISAAELQRFIDENERVQDDGQIQSGADIDLTR